MNQTIDTNRKFLITEGTQLLSGGLTINLKGITIKRKNALNFLVYGKTENKLPFKTVLECQDLTEANKLWSELTEKASIRGVM
jgi:hypothetical protein